MSFVVPAPRATFDVRLDDGAVIRLRQHGNPDGARLLITHGNGFAADAYFPFWQHFLADYDLIVFDFRNHGQNIPVEPPNHHYAQLTRDLECVLDAVDAQLGRKKTAGIFHSMSARTAMKHAVEVGWRWDALVLFDPPNVPPVDHPQYETMRVFENKLTDWARNRRRHFASVDELTNEYLQSRGSKGWVAGAHELMARSVLRTNPDREGYVLVCAPENEATIYAEALTLNLWPQASAFGGPVKLIGADPELKFGSPTGPTNRALGIENGYDYAFVAGTGHLLQIEKPEECVRIVREFLAQCGLEPGAAPEQDESAGGMFRLDAFPYRNRAKDVMSAPKFITADATIATAIARMAKEQISSLFVLPRGAAATAAPRPEDTGIITERDVVRVLAERGADALTMPAESATTWKLAAVAADAFVYRAVGRMNRLKVRHLGVADALGRLCGALSAHDLLRQRAQESVWLGDEIDQADDAAGLAAAWSKLPMLAACLVPEGVSGRDVAAVISAEIGALTRRAAELAEQRMQADGHGAPPCPYAVGVLGSAGRGESLLAMEQDNALVFAEGAPEGPEDRWFATFASHANEILHQAGVPSCKGGVMAKNAAWRGSLLTWRDRIADWIKRSKPDDLRSVDTFFDLRGVHGDLRLASTLRQDAYDVAAGEAGFAKLLAEAAGTVEPGLTFFGGFRADDGRIDLKKTGMLGIVTAARALAIRHHIAEQTTLARIEAIKALKTGRESDLDALAEAQGVFLDLILRQQVDDIDTGRPATNTVRVKRLSKRDSDRLYTAFQAVKRLDDLVRNLLVKG